MERIGLSADDSGFLHLEGLSHCTPSVMLAGVAALGLQLFGEGGVRTVSWRAVLRLFLQLEPELIRVVFFVVVNLLVDLLPDRQLKGLVENSVDAIAALHLYRVVHEGVGAEDVLEGHPALGLGRVRLQMLLG